MHRKRPPWTVNGPHGALNRLNGIVNGPHGAMNALWGRKRPPWGRKRTHGRLWKPGDLESVSKKRTFCEQSCLFDKNHVFYKHRYLFIKRYALLTLKHQVLFYL